MVKRYKTFDPQLVVVEHTTGSAVVLTNEAKLSLYKKSQRSGISTDILEKVYVRGYNIWNESFGQTPEQFAFDRVNSFVAGGFAAQLDDDLINEDGKGYKNPTGGLTQKGRDHYNRQSGGHLQAPVTTPPSKLKHDSKAAGRRRSFCARMGGVEGPMKKPNGEPTRKALALRKWNCHEDNQLDEKRGLWDNIHAKQERIKHGSGEHMRKPGSKGAPTAAALKNSQTNEAANPAQQAAIAIAMKKAGKKPQNEELISVIKEAVAKFRKKKGFVNSETSEKQSSNPNDSESRFDGTTSAKNVYTRETPGQKLKEDSEYGMARNELATAKRAIDRLNAKMGKGEGELEAWVQAKITKASDYLDTVADYIESGSVKEEVDLDKLDKLNKNVDSLVAATKKPDVNISTGSAAERREFAQGGEVRKLNVNDPDGKIKQASVIEPNMATKKPQKSPLLNTVRKVVNNTV